MEVNRATISSGSVGTFRSHTTLPVSSTTHTAVSFTETSRPTKYVIAIAPSSLLEVTVTPIWSSHVEGLRSTYSATQPPRYTIFGWIPDLHLRRRWRWRHGDWSKQANASEDERDLRAQLPSRTVFRPQRIVISSQGEVHRQLATDLHDPAHVGAYRQGPGVVAGGAPVRGKDRRTADIPPAAKIVVPKRLDQEHVVARAGGRQERRRAIAPDSPTARPG